MFVKVNGFVKNSFGRVIPIGDVIEVSDERGDYLIRTGQAEEAQNIRKDYQNQVARIKNNENLDPPQEEKKSWLRRVTGL